MSPMHKPLRDYMIWPLMPTFSGANSDIMSVPLYYDHCVPSMLYRVGPYKNRVFDFIELYSEF